MADEVLDFKQPGKLLNYGLPTLVTLFVLRMVWVARRDALPTYHSYWFMHTPAIFAALFVAVIVGGVALAWRYIKSQWVILGELALAAVLNVAGVGEWAPAMLLIAYWALIMTVRSDATMLAFGVAAAAVLSMQAAYGDWEASGRLLWFDALPGLMPVLIVGAIAYAIRGQRLSALAERREQAARRRAQELARQRDAATRRSSIVGEMHDSVGHDLTSIIALSQGLEVQLDADTTNPETLQAIHAIHDLAHSGLNDTRRAIHALSATDAEALRKASMADEPMAGKSMAEKSTAAKSAAAQDLPSSTQSLMLHDTPCYAWDDIRPVLAQARACGVIVTLAETGARSRDARQADLCFRVTREAVTNAMRHAPELSYISISWNHADDGSTSVNIANDGVHTAGAGVHAADDMEPPDETGGGRRGAGHRRGVSSQTSEHGNDGTGLRRYANEIEQVGGLLQYGADAETGTIWYVTANIPAVPAASSVPTVSTVPAAGNPAERSAL